MNRTLKTLTALGVAAATLSLAACGDKDQIRDISGPAPTTWIKFYNFGVNAPQVNFYVNETKMTAIVSTTGIESTSGVAYGSVSAGGFYSGVEPGTYTVTGRISATTDKNLPIATTNVTLADGKAYSYYMSGFYNTTTKVSDGFLLEDAFPANFDYTQAYVRFVNGISNAAPMQLIARNTTVATIVDTIGAAVTYKNGGTFETVVPGIYNLATRTVGATTDAITRTAVTFVAGRVYTISSRGDMTVVSTTATNRPFLDNTLNR